MHESQFPIVANGYCQCRQTSDTWTESYDKQEMQNRIDNTEI